MTQYKLCGPRYLTASIFSLQCAFSAVAGHADPLAPPVEASVALENKTPLGVFAEAEASFDGGADGTKILTDATASAGRAVELKGDWDRFPIAVPAGASFKVWVRHKYGPIALKGTQDGQEKELKWDFETPKNWVWSDFGTYTREQLGKSIVLMRNKQGQDANPQVDAVVFAPDTVRPLPPFEPDDQAAPLVVKTTISWDKVAGKVAPEMWGVNDYEILNPQKAANEGLQAYLAQVKFPIIRIHEGGFTDRWTDGATSGWNVEKIKAGFAASTGYGDAKVMMNIAGWPGWLQGGNYLPPEKVDEFVTLVGQLVKIMRDDVKHPIAYWELPNEKESEYEKLGKLDELWSLFNKLSAEIKKQDPTAKVGGSAMSWPNPVWVDGFFKHCAPNADFISWHNYGSGSIYDSNEALFSKPADFAKNGRRMRELAAQYAPGREFGTFLTEYNVKWTWTPYERRHENNVGAVFMASTIRQVALSGISGVMHWHVKGNSYGMINDASEKRLPAYLYLWGTRYLIGNIAQSTVDDEQSMEVMPVVRADGSQSVLLINKANRTIKLVNGAALIPHNPQSGVWMSRLEAKGYQPPSMVPTQESDLMLPGYSVTILSTTPKPSF